MDSNTGAPQVHKEPGKKVDQLVVNKIIVQNVDRTMKDIGRWRQAHQAAENKYYPVRYRLYDIYADVLLDGHLSGLIQKRFDAVLNKQLTFQKDGVKIDELDALINSRAFRTYRQMRLEDTLWGIGGAEFIPGKEFCFAEIPRKHIKPELRIIAKEQSGTDGYDYSKLSNVIVYGDRNDFGLLLKCTPYCLWKRGGWSDYAEFVEIFGRPVRIFEYDAFDVETKRQVDEIMQTSGGALALSIPKQAMFRMEDGKTANANGDLQTKFITALNSELSILILGNTETTSSSSSSGYAQSKEHGKQQLEITKSDMDVELMNLNDERFLAVLASYGYPVEGGAFVHEREVDIAELAERIKVDAELVKIIPIDDDYFYEKYAIPKPDNYEALKQKMEDEKILQSMQAAAPEAAPGKKPAEGIKKPKPEIDDLSEDGLWHKMRLKLADFFDPAP